MAGPSILRVEPRPQERVVTHRPRPHRALQDQLMLRQQPLGRVLIPHRLLLHLAKAVQPILRQPLPQLLQPGPLMCLRIQALLPLEVATLLPAAPATGPQHPPPQGAQSQLLTSPSNAQSEQPMLRPHTSDHQLSTLTTQAKGTIIRLMEASITRRITRTIVMDMALTQVRATTIPPTALSIIRPTIHTTPMATVSPSTTA